MAKVEREQFNLLIIREGSGPPHRVEAIYMDKGQEKFVLTDTANHLVDMVVRLLEKLNILDREVGKLKAELSKWTCKHNDADLRELEEQAKGSYSFGACRAYVNGLEHHLKQAEAEVNRLKPLALNGIVLAQEAEKLYIKQIKEVMPLKELIQTKPLTEAYAAGLTKAIEVIESIRK